MTRSDADRGHRPRTRFLTLLLGITLVAPALWAQDTTSADDRGGSVFAPFVSRLRLSMRDPEVRLTWEDSEDVDGTYRVYRHTSEIDASSFLDSELVAVVEPGVQSFIDTPSEPGQYYYAVLAESSSGDLYEIFIAYRNATSVAIAVENVATLVERSARVREIQASVDGGVILVEYESDQIGRELIIYRSTQPFTTLEDLSSSGIVATVVSAVESVTDYPVPGVPYYYGVVDSALVAEGSVVFEPGENTTAMPVEVSLPTIASEAQTSEPEPELEPETAVSEAVEPAAETSVVQPTEVASLPDTPASELEPPPVASSTDGIFAPAVSRRRPLPLPFLQLNTNLQTGATLGDAVITVPEWQPVSRQTEESVEQMLGLLTQQETVEPRPQVLTEDTLPSPSGAEFTLRTILDGPFASLAWEDALSQLSNFLSLPLSRDVRSRALFYRAQCFYFTGESERAFVEFLLARNDHFGDVEDWLDVILSNSAGA